MAALNLKLHPRSILETSAKLSCAQQKSEVRKHWSLLLVVHAAAEAHPVKCGSSLRKENLKAATQGKAKAAKRHGLRAAAQPGQPRIPQIGPGTGPSMRTATLQSALLGAVSAPRPGQRMAPAQAFEPWGLLGALEACFQGPLRVVRRPEACMAQLSSHLRPFTAFAPSAAW